MEITRLGHSSFKLRGKSVTVVTDPFKAESVGFKLPSVEAKIVTISHSHDDHSFAQGVKGEPTVINGPGEYEIAEVFIRGISSFHDAESGAKRGKNVIYRIEMDKMVIAHLGDLGHKLTDEEIDQLGNVDILMIPVGGVYTIDSPIAAEVVAQIEPSIVIPMHYLEDRLNKQIFGGLTTVDAFFAQIGKKKNVMPKLSITRDRLPNELLAIALE